MLRDLLGESARTDNSQLQVVMAIMEQYLHIVQQKINRTGDPHYNWRKIEIWLAGLQTSLNELEQSIYAAGKFAERVSKQYEVEMDTAEQDNYYRYVYFYKNGLIRIFSILDKLGSLLDSVLHLQTNKVKQHFSYFTVLRQLQTIEQHTQLTHQLTLFKHKYNQQLQRLRKQRNLEIHHMNPEMEDDLWQKHFSLHNKIKLEDIQAHIRDIQAALKMVYEIINRAIQHLIQNETESFKDKSN